jgi:hypothetical protein
MHETFAIALSPRSQHAPAASQGDGGLGGLWLALGILGWTLLMVSIPVSINYWIDVRLHEGVSLFKRRRVLKNGTIAEATILSCEVLMKNTGSRYRSAYSIVYEVHVPGGGCFRAKGIEVMLFSESTANRLSTGERVEVRYDSETRLVVLVRVDRKKVDRDREAARRAKEEKLLREGN